jgi:uncharacterized protein DUF6982
MNIDSAINSVQSSARETTEIKPAKVITRYVDGKVLKGYSHDFFPNKTTFHIFPRIDEPMKEGTKIQMGDLKAVFFVRDFTGDPSYDEQKCFPQDKKPIGRKIEITFNDGEVLTGTTVGYTPNRIGFFLFPVDLRSNNLRVFVISAAVRALRFS